MGRHHGCERVRCAAPRVSASSRFSVETLEPRTLLSAELVRDILPPSSTSFDVINPDASQLVKAGDSAFFATSHYPKGRLLWKTDGTPDGTRLVADFTEYPAWKTIEHFVELNGLTYFLFDDALWQTDGLPSGTSIVQADQSARYFVEPSNLVESNGAIYFTDGGTAGNGRLWRSDGTPGGLQRIFPVKAKDAATSAIGKPVAIGDALVFQVVASGRVEIWRTDGTAAGTYPLIDSGAGVGQASAGSPFYHMGGSLYVLYHDGDGSGALWRTNGTRGGTEVVREFGTRLSGAVVDGNIIYFGTYTDNAAALWRSDGTSGGTRHVETLNSAQPTIGIPNGLRASSYFVTSSVDRAVVTIPGEEQKDPSPLADFHLAGGTAVFTAEVDGIRQLFRTDGTEVGTRQITDFYSFDRDYDPMRDFTTVGETLYFTVTQSPNDAGTLYATDGSVGGTRRLWDNGTDPNLDGHYDPQQGQIQHLSSVDGMLYFTGYLPKTGKDVLRWDATGSISGVLFNDVNYDGLRQDSEIGLRGWKVFLDKNRDGERDPGEPFVRTNSAGRYRFHSLPPGTYTIGVVLEKEDWLSTMPAAKWNNTVPVVSGRTSKLNLSATQVDQTPGSIAGTIFSDRSSIDLPPTFPSRAANLRVFIDLDRDGHWDSTTEPSDLSDSNGSYRIDELTAGRYPLVVQLGDSPYTQFPPDFPDIPDVSIDRLISVLPGRQNASDFWLHFDPAESSIKGRVFNDKDVDGSADASEAGFASQKLYLDRNFDHKHSPGEPVTTTDGNGNFIFSSLKRGYYSVRVVSLPAGNWTTTTQTAGTIDLDYYDQASIDFGFAPDLAGTVSGTVYYDKNANGRRDNDEPGIGSRSVAIEQSGASVQAFTTQSDGRFTFEVDSGSYTLRSIGSPGADWDPSSPTSQSIFVLPSRSTAIDFGFKYNPNSVLRGKVFDDRDHNRTRGPSEEVIEGIEVYLDYNRNGRRDPDEPSDTSGSEGIYEFKNLRAGDYQVRILNLDWDFINSNTAGVSHDQQRDFDLNLRPFAGVRGYAFLDDDGDKRFDEGETLVAGVRIYRDENEDGEFTFGERYAVSPSAFRFSLVGTGTGEVKLGVIVPDGYITGLQSVEVDFSDSAFHRVDIPLRRE